MHDLDGKWLIILQKDAVYFHAILVNHTERYRERPCIRHFFLLLGIILPTGLVFIVQLWKDLWIVRFDNKYLKSYRHSDPLLQ